jgi:NADPH:quinone reductase
MRRVRYYEFGDPDVLRIEEADVPEPGAGQVLIQTEVIGASFVDTVMRRGTSAFAQQPLPGSPHGDVVGVVTSTGPGANSDLVGERVAALVSRDAYADYVVADADWLARVPSGVESAEASVLDMPAPVALRILRTGKLATGETVLVHAAGGNLGHLLTQLARLEGAATVIATVGSVAKAEFARQHGADVVVCYADADWPDQVLAIAPAGVDLVADSMGGQLTVTSLELVAPLGRLVIYGALTGELPAIPAPSLVGLRWVTGFRLAAWRSARPDLARQDIADVAAYAAAGQFSVAVHATVPLAEAVKAHELLEDRSRTGRVLLVP